jgi:hypothetical protein
MARQGFRWIAASSLGLAGLLLGVRAMAAPFSYDPVSFTSFANSRMKALGKDVVFRNLALCRRDGASGYRCLEGDVLRREAGQPGRELCRLRSVGYHPATRSINYLTKDCVRKTDQQRLREQSEKLLRKGLDALENLNP